MPNELGSLQALKLMASCAGPRVMEDAAKLVSFLFGYYYGYYYVGYRLYVCMCLELVTVPRLQMLE